MGEPHGQDLAGVTSEPGPLGESCGVDNGDLVAVAYDEAGSVGGDVEPVPALG